MSLKQIIRPVNPASDTNAITAIYNQYIEKTTVSFETDTLSTEQMRKRIRDISSEYPYLVYETDGQVIGYAYVHRWKERAAYSLTVETTIYLSPGHKHEGVGTALMHELIERCKAAGYKVLIACITGENTESINFHSSLGFVQASHFHNVGYKFGRMLDVIDMELQL